VATEILAQSAAFELAIIVTFNDLFVPNGCLPESSAGTWNAFNHLVSGKVAALELSARIKHRDRTLCRTKRPAAGASNTANHSVVLQHYVTKATTGEKLDDRSFGNMGFAEVDLPRDGATFQATIREKPRIAARAMVALDDSGLVQVLSLGFGRSSGKKNRRADQDRE